MLTPEEEEEIIKGLRTGGAVQKGAESRLYNNFKEEFLRRGAYKYGLMNHDVNEAYNNTILAVIGNVVAQKYEPRLGKSLEGYAASIFKHKCIDVTRKQINNFESIDESLVNKLPDKSKGVVRDIIEKEFKTKMHNCYERIGEGCKMVLMLFTEGFKDREIAEKMLYKSEDVAKQKRYACFEKLRECLNLAKYE